ncbi:hypothetical protein FBEOM_5248 [Fusarium beomiforme]|uniref:Uncharacterized protein n=1 Tax=Fusarium beomiforme TaxID=44412 RepID=A0A9P5DXA7_9HYPO|nr:hypothetical protein FBEOM_5248 [Fusarium beomiforme]
MCLSRIFERRCEDCRKTYSITCRFERECKTVSNGNKCRLKINGMPNIHDLTPATFLHLCDRRALSNDGDQLGDETSQLDMRAVDMYKQELIRDGERDEDDWSGDEQEKKRRESANRNRLEKKRKRVDEWLAENLEEKVKKKLKGLGLDEFSPQAKRDEVAKKSIEEDHHLPNQMRTLNSPPQWLTPNIPSDPYMESTTISQLSTPANQMHGNVTGPSIEGVRLSPDAHNSSSSMYKSVSVVSQPSSSHTETNGNDLNDKSPHATTTTGDLRVSDPIWSNPRLRKSLGFSGGDRRSRKASRLNKR